MDNSDRDDISRSRQKKDGNIVAVSKLKTENPFRETFNMVAPDLGTGLTSACA
jgi:hypothetical protein